MWKASIMNWTKLKLECSLTCVETVSEIQRLKKASSEQKLTLMKNIYFKKSSFKQLFIQLFLFFHKLCTNSLLASAGQTLQTIITTAAE